MNGMRALASVSVGGVTVTPTVAPFRGLVQTLDLMTKHVFTGERDPLVRRTAESIVTGLYGKDYLSEAAAIGYWVSDQRNVRYIRDPVKVELVKDARKVLETRSADCDELSLLLLAMWRSIGIQAVRFVCVGFKPNKILTHVFPSFLDPRSHRWIVVDPVAGPATGGMLRRAQAWRAFPPLSLTTRAA